jgi:putative ABC transport system permease protein
MSKWLADLKHAARSLVRSPGFALSAAATLALGIGANAAIFSVVYSVLLRPLPFPDPERIVSVSEADASRKPMALCDPNFRDLRERSRNLAAFAEWTAYPVSVSGGSEPVRTTRAVVSRDFFSALGTPPAEGRAFSEDELRVGGPAAAVVSQSFRERYLSGERDLSRLALRFEGELYRVVGVMPAGFRFPEDAQVWTPRERWPVEISRSAHNWRGVGRLRGGVSLGSARAELDAIAAGIRRENGDDANLTGAVVAPLRDALVGRARPALLMLLAAVAVLMLVAAANVANLSLARAAARRRELAVRAALGATRGDLFRSAFAEALLVSLAGAAGGLLICGTTMGAIRSLSGESLPRSAEIALDPPVLVFAFAVCVAAALAVAAAASRRSLLSQSRDLAGGRSGATAGAWRVQSSLLGLQAALTALLLSGVALFGRSFLRVLDVRPGFHERGAVAVDLFPDMPSTEAEKGERIQRIDRLRARLAPIPGVRRVGAVGTLPLGSEAADGTFLLVPPGERVAGFADFERLARNKANTGLASYCAADPDYFPAMGIPLRAGRLFDARDVRSSAHVALLSESLARRRFEGADPIGRTIEFGNMDGDLETLTVVGVVGDVRQQSLEAAPEPIVYVNLRQRPQKAYPLTFVLRLDGDAAAAAPVVAAARAAIREIDPTLPPRFRRLEDVVSDSLAARRFSLTLLGVFGALALLLATSGVASVTAFAVARRRSELGIRLALGARTPDLLRHVVGRHLRTIAIGAAAGLVAAAALASLLRAQLFGVPPWDPWSFAGSLAVVGAVGLVACAVPALQVVRIDPNEALRAE